MFYNLITIPQDRQNFLPIQAVTGSSESKSRVEINSAHLRPDQGTSRYTLKGLRKPIPKMNRTLSSISKVNQLKLLVFANSDGAVREILQRWPLSRLPEYSVSPHAGRLPVSPLLAGLSALARFLRARPGSCPAIRPIPERRAFDYVASLHVAHGIDIRVRYRARAILHRP